MSEDVMTSLDVFSASEILSEIDLDILETVGAADTVVVQKESFSKFSGYLEKIRFLLKEFFTFDISNSESFQNAIDILNRKIKVAKQLTVDCRNRNKIYLLLNCRRIVKHLEESTKEISQALGFLNLVCPNIPSGLNDHINKLSMSMLSEEYQTNETEEEILQKIESGLQERNVDKSCANNLITQIAETVGISVEQSELRNEFEDLKSTMENVEMRKNVGVGETLQMEQIISFLGKADVITTPAEKEVKYFRKRNSLGRHLVEPLPSFFCPITWDIMIDPVETSSGHSFERSAIEKWLADGNSVCPLTKTPLKTPALRSNRTLRQSIEEWRDRNAMIAMASMKPKIQSDEEEEVLYYLCKLQDLCMEKDFRREWVVMEGYIPILVTLLYSKNCEIRKHALVILYILGNHSDDNKETIAKVDNAIKSIVHSLSRKVDEIKLALKLLLELSRSSCVRNLIGDVQGCIILLLTISRSDDMETARDAQALLENLSFLDQNVIQMARTNYFLPLLHLLSAGSKNTKMTMAKTLSEIELTVYSKLSLFKDGALHPLLQMLSDSDLDMKMAAVEALQNLSSVSQIGLQMIKEGALGPLFETLYRHSLSSPSLREHVVAIIMHLAISTTAQEADQAEVSLLQSEEDTFKLFSLISLTSPNAQLNILVSFNALCRSPSGLDIRTTLRQLSAVKILLQLCEGDDHNIRGNAVKLIYYLTQDSDETTFLEHVGLQSIEKLLKIIKTSKNSEEVVAGMGIIKNLPRDDRMTQWLLDAGALEVIFTFLAGKNNNSGNEPIENAAGALTRFTVSNKKEWQKNVAEAGFIPVLVQLLVTGTNLSKQNAAVSLRQFSENSASLSSPVKKHGIFQCCLSSQETVCPVHLGICTTESSFCLVEANAIGPLVRILGKADVGACDASLDALLTLIEGEQLQRGSKVLGEANAFAPMIKLLSSSCADLQEKSLRALERVFRLVEFNQKYGKSAEMALVEITQRGSSGMKSLAAKVLSHLHVLPQHSSFF